MIESSRESGGRRGIIMADFGSLFESHCTLSKRLESRWFCASNSSLFAGGLRHRMPFLRRNLSYIRTDGGDSTELEEGKKGRRKRGRAARAAKLGRSIEGPKKRRKGGGAASDDAVWEVLCARSPLDEGRTIINILLKVFKHHTSSVNPALLFTPVRSTRAMSAAEPVSSAPGTTPKEDFIARQSSVEKVIRDVELADDADVESRSTDGVRGGGERGCRRSLVLAEPRMARAAREAEEELRTEKGGDRVGCHGDGCAPQTGDCEADESSSLLEEEDCLDIPKPKEYNPYRNGRYVQPLPPRTAFDIFVLTERDAVRRSLPRGPERRDKNKIKKRLRKIWNGLSPEELKRYVKEEMREKERYKREREVFVEARKRGPKNMGSGCARSNGSDGAECSETGLNSKEEVAKENVEEKGNTRTLQSVRSDCSGGAGPAWKDAEKAGGTPRKIFYHYVYLESEGVPLVQVEMRHDRRCPLCYFHFGTISALTVHGQMCHEPDITFKLMTGEMLEDGNFHVRLESNIPLQPPVSLVARNQTPGHCNSDGINKLRDFVFVRRSDLCRRSFNSTVDDERRCRNGETLAVPGVGCGCLDPEPANHTGTSENPSEITEVKEPPLRQYYHSRTNLPLLRADWNSVDSVNSDSDEEPDDTWLHRMGEELMDEFEDLSPDEKIFMNEWNRYAKRHTVVGDRNVPGMCMAFVMTRGCWLVERGLRQNLLCHLFTLWDEGVISSDHMLKTMAAYDEVATTTTAADAEHEEATHDSSATGSLTRKMASSDDNRSTDCDGSG